MQSIKQRDTLQGKRMPLHFYSCLRTWQEALEEQGGQEEVVQEEEEGEEDDVDHRTKAL
jgi:hypothetical protein